MAWHGRRVVLALLAGLLVHLAVQAVRPAPPPTSAVVVLSHDVTAGAQLRAGDVRVARYAEGTVPDRALHTAVEAVVRRVPLALERGSPLTESALSPVAERLPPGQVAVPVELAQEALADLLEPGQRVDLVADRDGRPSRLAAGAVVLSRAQRQSGAALVDTASGSTALVSVTEEEAPGLATATTPVSVVLLGPD